MKELWIWKKKGFKNLSFNVVFNIKCIMWLLIFTSKNLLISILKKNSNIKMFELKDEIFMSIYEFFHLED